MGKNHNYSFCVYCKAKHAARDLIGNDIEQHREHIRSCHDHPLGHLYDSLNAAYHKTTRRIRKIGEKRMGDRSRLSELTTKAEVYKNLLVAIEKDDFSLFTV